MKRLLDIMLCIILLLLLSVPLLTLILFLKFTTKGTILYWSDRVGKNNKLFSMPKFRTMKIDTPVVATHLLSNASNHLIPFGSFFRKSSLDEIPQLWSILIGDMSFIGPRPALYNQYDLIKLRTEFGVHTLLPGLSGWAQVNGRDDLTIVEKVNLDVYYLHNRNFIFDLRILLITLFKVFKFSDISH